MSRRSLTGVGTALFPYDPPAIFDIDVSKPVASVKMGSRAAETILTRDGDLLRDFEYLQGRRRIRMSDIVAALDFPEMIAVHWDNVDPLGPLSSRPLAEGQSHTVVWYRRATDYAIEVFPPGAWESKDWSPGSQWQHIYFIPRRDPQTVEVPPGYMIPEGPPADTV